MEISISKNETSVCVTVVGRVDAYESPALTNAIEDELEEQPAHLIVDLLDVDYLDSSGLAVLVRTWRAQETRRRRLSLVMPESEPAKRIFSLAGFDGIFEELDRSAVGAD